MKLIVADALASMDMDMRERYANAFVMGLREVAMQIEGVTQGA